MTDSITRSLTLAKLQQPRIGHGRITRPQRLERLDASQSLTLILAPAGYGKTTLLSMWFVNYLIEALHTMFPAVADDTLGAINSVAAPPPAAIARSLLNDLVDVEQDFILMLDDYHFIHNQTIHDLLTEVGRHPPRMLHLVIASQHDPPLPLAGLRARLRHGAARGCSAFHSQGSRAFPGQDQGIDGR
jgi:LuxR family transcriptional regulator, maltose regulon positive regulatory protein